MKVQYSSNCVCSKWMSMDKYMFLTAKHKQVLHLTWSRAWISAAISQTSARQCGADLLQDIASNDVKVCPHIHKNKKGWRFPKGFNWAHPSVCAAWWELVGQFSPSLSFPLTSVFLSTYLWPSHSMQTLISTSCVLAQWNDLPEATWQGMNSSGPSPASCSLLIRRHCARVMAGLSIPTLFPTSHASFPLPRATEIARCMGLRNMYATTQAWRTGCHSWLHLRWRDGVEGQDKGAGVVHIPRQKTILNGSTHWPSVMCPLHIYSFSVESFITHDKKGLFGHLFYEGLNQEWKLGHLIAIPLSISKGNAVTDIQFLLLEAFWYLCCLCQRKYYLLF